MTRIVEPGASAPTPLAGVLVDAFSASGHGSDSLYASGGEFSARTYSQADGSWTMRVPTGSWALRYRTSMDQPFYPGYVWAGCVIEPSHVPPPPGTPPPAGTAYVTAPASGIELTVGSGTCDGSTAGGGGPGGGGPGGGGPGGEPGPGGSGEPAVTASRATSSANGTVTVSVNVSGPGKLTATAKAPQKAVASARKRKGSSKRKRPAKPVVVAKGAAKPKKAGTIKLVLKPTKAARKLLNRGRKLTATATISFKPTTGPAVKTTKRVTFKKKPAGKRTGGKKR